MWRPPRGVPLRLWLALLAALLLQGLGRLQAPAPEARAAALPAAPPAAALQLLGLGDRALAARLTGLWLQAFEARAGLATPLHALDYGRLEDWLGRVLDLDPGAEQPLRLAARLYAGVEDPARQRRMLEFVHRRFLEWPERRWPWLAHAVLLARHRLHDLPLALRYARSLAERAEAAPAWARQMQIFVLADMGRLAQARALLAREAALDGPERCFLLARLAAGGPPHPGRPAGWAGCQPVRAGETWTKEGRAK